MLLYDPKCGLGSDAQAQRSYLCLYLCLPRELGRDSYMHVDAASASAREQESRRRWCIRASVGGKFDKSVRRGKSVITAASP